MVMRSKIISAKTLKFVNDIMCDIGAYFEVKSI